MSKELTPEEKAIQRAGDNIKLSTMYRPGYVEPTGCTTCSLCVKRAILLFRKKSKSWYESK